MAKWWVLVCLYLSQGLPHGFFSQALPAIMREQGMSLETIGLLSIGAVPWLLKFLWAPVLDHYRPLSHLFPNLHLRKRWIALANVAALSTFVVLACWPLEVWLQHPVMLALVLLTLTFFIASQDISTDALTVENIKPEQRGLANSLQVAGYRVGMVISGGLLLAVFNIITWQGVMLVMALLMFLALIPLWRWQPEAVQTSPSLTAQDWLVFFKRSGWLIWLLLLMTYKAGDAFATAMIRPHFIDLGMQFSDFAQLLGLWGTLAGLAGALFGGVLLTVMSRYKALFIFLLLEALVLACYSLLTELDWQLIHALVITEHITGGMSTVALFTIMMDKCQPSSAASDYAIQSSFIVLATLIATAFSGFSAAALGYQRHYLLAAGLCLLGLLVLIFARQQITNDGVSIDRHLENER